ncbi:nucleotide-diphospho-sugar transferase [Lipomyces orientalis]|uniref:Nucleotide-diphospho-sugar transferase n=1 Tax=Lipomyces orientalis TaxID=1233043 RepID=A0ACC3TJ50_9ASCO
MLRLLHWRRTPRWIAVAIVFVFGLSCIVAITQLVNKIVQLNGTSLSSKLGSDNVSPSKSAGTRATSQVYDTTDEFVAMADGQPQLEKATFIMLVRNSEVHDARSSIRYVEDRFNKNFHYPWLFLNDRPFSQEFIRMTRVLVSGNATYGQIPKEAWSMPDWVDRQKARECMKDMANRNILYGGSESYRHMCRFFSGFFWRHELLANYDYYWRVEPNTQLYCDLTYDPFTFMRENNKTYGFTINLLEFASTIESLWPTVQNFSSEHPEYIHQNNSLDFVVDDHKSITEGSYNNCHYWSNFEIASLKFFRSQPYRDFFDALDQTGGFYYERWGDAPVHSLAVSIMLDKEEIHWFYDIGYRHHPFTHCPEPREEFHDSGKCYCNPRQNFDRNPYSCTKQYQRMRGDSGSPEHVPRMSQSVLRRIDRGKNAAQKAE